MLLSLMSMCVRLATFLAGPSSSQWIAWVWNWEMILVSWFIPKLFKTYHNEATEVQLLASAVNLDSVQLSDIDLSILLTGNIGALPYWRVILAQLLQVNSWADLPFQSTYVLIWFQPQGFNSNDQSEYSFKYHNAPLAAPNALDKVSPHVHAVSLQLHISLDGYLS